MISAQRHDARLARHHHGDQYLSIAYSQRLVDESNYYQRQGVGKVGLGGWLGE